MKKILISLLVVSSLVFGFSASQVAAQGMTIDQLVELFISLGIISPDRAVAARAAVAGSSGVSPAPTNTSGFCHSWNTNITIGANSDDVSALQTVLAMEGILAAKDTPFNEDMAAAVVKFQAKHGIAQTGYVGPLTRAKLNELYKCGQGAVPSTNTPTCSLSSDKDSYKLGDTITYSWVSKNATYAVWQQDTSGKDHLWLPGDKLPSSGSQEITANVVGNPSVTLSVGGYNGTGLCTKTVNITYSTQPQQPSITVLSPNGGESYIAGSSSIRISFQSSGISKQLLTAYLYSPTLGNVRSINTYADSGSVYMSLAKGDVVDQPGQYKITLCANNVDSPITPGKPLCDTSDNYFTLVSSTAQTPIKIYWNNGTNNVQVGLVDTRFSSTNSNVLGWISLKNSTNGSVEWDGQSVTDLTGKVTWKVSSLSSGPFRIIGVTADKSGNYCMGSSGDGECNYVLSSYFKLPSYGSTIKLPSFALNGSSKSCTDSDGGQNPDIAGLTDNRVNGLGSYFKDASVTSNGGACSGSTCTAVAEGYCTSSGEVTNILTPCLSRYSADGACRANPSVDSSSISPSASIVGSGESVILSLVHPTDIVQQQIYINCPSGITVKGTSENVCNQWLNLPLVTTSYGTAITNKSTQQASITVDYRIYTADNPNYAKTVSTQVTVRGLNVSIQTSAKTTSTIVGSPVVITSVASGGTFQIHGFEKCPSTSPCLEGNNSAFGWTNISTNNSPSDGTDTYSVPVTFSTPGTYYIHSFETTDDGASYKYSSPITITVSAPTSVNGMNSNFGSSFVGVSDILKLINILGN